MKRKSLSVYAQVKRMTTARDRRRKTRARAPTFKPISSAKSPRRRKPVGDLKSSKGASSGRTTREAKQQENKTNITCGSLPQRPRCSAVFEVRRKELAKTGPARPRTWIIDQLT